MDVYDTFTGGYVKVKKIKDFLKELGLYNRKNYQSFLHFKKRTKHTLNRFVKAEDKDGLLLVYSLSNGITYECVSSKGFLEQIGVKLDKKNIHEFNRMKSGGRRTIMFNEELFCLLSEKDNIPNRSLCNKNYSKSKGYKDRIKKQKLQRRLSNNLRSRIRHSVISKNQKSLDLTGCSIEQLMAHLESKFSDGMTWENYGEWHIDHIKPCAKFDLTLESEQEKCFHFSNLQPLWAEENFKKGSS